MSFHLIPSTFNFELHRSLATRENYLEVTITYRSYGPTVEACTSRVLPHIQLDSCNKHGPYSGPALTIMSFNVEGLSTAKQVIADLNNKQQCELCAYRRHTGDMITSGIDMTIVIPHEQCDSATFINTVKIINATSLPYFYNTDILTTNLNGVSVTSIYKPPGEPFSFDHAPASVGNQPTTTVHRYKTTNTESELVEDWTETPCLSHDPKLPSPFNSGRWRRGYYPDLTYVTSRMAG